MKKIFSYLACHYHKVDTITWLNVRAMLNNALLARIKQGREFLTLHMSNDDFDTISEFVEQMDTAYLHPRRDSYHIHILQTTYSNFRPKNSPLPPEHDKNLSQTANKSGSDSNNNSDFTKACVCFLCIGLLFLLASHLEYIFTQIIL